MGFFTLPKHPFFRETYISGFPEFTKPTIATVEVQPDQLLFQLFKFGKMQTVIIPEKDIIELSLNQEIFRSAGKAAAGAIIGGVLTGGIGLIAGAALGGKRRKENEMKLVVKYQQHNCDIIFKQNKNFPKLVAEIKKIMTIRTREAIEESSSADELLKFADLRDKGILTNDEFEAKKKQILGL